MKEYQRIGLVPPEAVRVATEAYRQENDSLASFIAENCNIQKLAFCKNTELRAAYENFCRINGLEELSPVKFSLELKEKPGVTKKRDMFGYSWFGIGLKRSSDADSVAGDRNTTLHRKDEPTDNDSKTAMYSMKENVQSSSSESHVENFAEKDTYPTCAENEGSTDAEKIYVGLHKTHENYVGLNPGQLSKLWQEVGYLLKKEPRVSNGKIGLFAPSLADACKLEPETIVSFLESKGFVAETIGASSLAIWMAPPNVLEGLGIAREA